MPVNDGAILPVDSDSRSLGSVPLLLGFTRNEARYFIRPGMLPYNRIILRAMTKVLASAQAKAVLAQLAAQGSSTYDRCDQVYTAAIWAEPMWTTAKRLLASGHQFYCYRFDRVSPGAAASNFLAKHTAELRYLVLPQRPAGTEGMTEDELAELVTRDSMIGVAKIPSPRR